MQKTFLSVDIDYWNQTFGHPSVASLLRTFLSDLVLGALSRGIPVSAVMNHQQMLRLVNDSGATRLVNIDTHSDIRVPDSTLTELHCGSWVSYVRQRLTSEYHWIHGGAAASGDCQSYPGLFDDNCRDAVFEDYVEGDALSFRIHETRKMLNWKRVTHVQTDPLDLPRANTFLRNCAAACVCMSPAYADADLVSVFNQWRHRYAIPYRKGRMNEEFGRSLHPNATLPRAA